MQDNIFTEPRLALKDVEVTTTAVDPAWDLLPVPNLFRVMANADSLYQPYTRYLEALLTRLELDAALEMMIILQVVKESDCYYAWRLNLAFAKGRGVSQEQIDALELGEITANCFTAQHRVAFRFAQETIQLIEVVETTFNDAKLYFSDRALTEILYLTGTYMFISRLLRTGRVPREASIPVRPYGTATMG